ncbi:benzoyl-CoA 2,3-epoxidase subunit BoxA [Futiania mangrovi]|uniref:Benzoyl-CoA 2,3-epoxidase subunit BoxA n=1 Tax=Futiania mangrovi TaxID=2959716 RepID=A0A9J6PC87_9PROT|nr:benzoyl-CoA 2,3-epoxidase subunit BoxA [Futiania mangrovii]MCP1335862.1 benzoyl-CoA 2,3-epoxidase subunit BoxA [Futiania mangrovii]
MNAPQKTPIKQHLIDPEICIRCYTCEEMCPIDAITHDDNNVVVDAAKCNYCMDCIAPCPTGSIDNWRMVMEPYSLQDQFSWDELPEQQDLGEADTGALAEAMEDEISSLLARAHEGTGGKPAAPASADKPSINLYSRTRPAVARVQGNYRITDEGTGSDVRHIILSFGEQVFPVLEGQSVGIVPPGTKPDGRPHDIRLYSVASARDGEKRNANNLALTVKREEGGVCSNYLCDLKKGDEVQVTGPFGGTFLMPNDPSANIVMICTGTGSAPFRAFTERRRRAMPGAPGKLILYFGARTPGELPYFGPLKKVPPALMEQHLVYSRVPDSPKEYVQDRMRVNGEALSGLLTSDRTHIYICGLKGMETGVDEALADICRKHGLDWATIKPVMRASGRYHVETY